MTVKESITASGFLPEGWAHGQGTAPSFGTRRAALLLCFLLEQRGYSEEQLEDFPFPDGSIELVLAANLEVSFQISSMAAVRVRFLDGDQYHLLSARCSVERAAEYVPRREWNSFDIFTLVTSASPKATSEDLALIPADQEYRLPVWTARYSIPAAPVLTEQSFTRTFPAVQSASSSFRTQSSQQSAAVYRRRQTIRATLTSSGSTKRRQSPSFSVSQDRILAEFDSARQTARSE